MLPALLAAAVLSPSPVAAADEDVQAWLYLNAIVPIGDDVEGTFEFSPRARADRAGGDILQLRGTIETEIAKGVSIGGGGAYIAAPGADEIRPHQQLVLDRGILSYRMRLEERFFDRADRAQIRLRQRITAAPSIGRRTKAIASFEWLRQLQRQWRFSTARRDQWRYNAGVQRKLSDRVSATLDYVLIHSPRDGTDAINHVGRLAIAYRF